MTNLAAMPIYGKNLKKSSSPEPIDWWPWNFVCSIVYASTTKIIQIIPWDDLDTFYAKVKFGDIGFCMGKVKIIYFFWNCCSLRIQLNELMKLSEYQRSRSFFDLGQRSLRFQS